MILTLTMNPAVDIGYTVETLKMDTVNRTQKVSKTPGGKGLNVSRVLKQLGSPVLATGLLGGHIGAFIKEKLDEVALENNFYPIQSETRNCIAILHEGLQTEILEAGPTITPEEQAGFLAHFETLLKKSILSRFLVACLLEWMRLYTQRLLKKLQKPAFLCF